MNALFHSLRSNKHQSIRCLPKLKLVRSYLQKLVQVIVCGFLLLIHKEPLFQHVLLSQKKQNVQLLSTMKNQFASGKMQNVEAITSSMTELIKHSLKLQQIKLTKQRLQSQKLLRKPQKEAFL